MEKIRVLHCLHSMNLGGAETMLMNLFRQIDKNKIVFDFLLTDQTKEGAYEAEIIQLGGRIYKIPVMKVYNPFSYLKALDVFFKNHNQEYRIVHSHTSSKSVFPLYYAKKWGIPIRIAHSHNNHCLHNFDGLIRYILKAPLKKCANNYFACAKVPAEWLYGSSFCKEHDITILYNAIDTNKYLYNSIIRESMRNALGILKNELVIGHVGRFSYQKNHEFLIDIFSEIIKMNPKSKLLLVGDGPIKKDIVDLTKKYELEEFVIFAGNVNNVPDYLQAMDVFLFPSRFEGLPVCMVEAQCTGLACVTSKEAVTTEVKITDDLVHYCSLNDSPGYWAKTVLDTIPYNRTSRDAEVKKCGYDIKETSSFLQNFYTEKYNEEIE